MNMGSESGTSGDSSDRRHAAKRLLQFLAVLLAGCSVGVAVAAAAESRDVDLGLLPRPVKLERQEGTWTLTRNARIVASGSAVSEAVRLSDALSGPLGYRVPVSAEKARTGDIQLTLAATRSDLGDEGYELRISPHGVQVTAREPAGLFYGGQTLRQLLPPVAWGKAPAGDENWSAPCLRIIDHPRFAWRGLLLDPARHFIPKAALRELIDVMAMHKLNRLQLHLTDDQGWRIEIKAFPRLTALSSWRSGTLLGHLRKPPETYSTLPHGGFYSQNDLREIVAYAAARHIVVVPEIEMPGHARAWLAAYPEFAVFPEKAAEMEVWRRWGVSKDVLAPRPATLEACRRILDEVCEIFPSPWIHIGGDEAPRDQWRESPEIQALIRSLGVRDEDGLQAWFTAEMSRHLAAKGRRLVGWDEILAGASLGGGDPKIKPAEGSVVMSWHGEKGGIEAALAGYDAVMTPHQWTYLDYHQGPPAEEPLGIGGSISLSRVYAYEPVPATVPEQSARRILGAQAQVWSEYLHDPQAVGYMAFPRASALAEVVWSPREGKELPDFLGRLERHEARLQALGVAYRPLARRISWPDESGRITARAEDAVIHGTEIVRHPDGSLGGWKNEFTMIAWRAQLEGGHVYRLLVQLGSTPAEKPDSIEAVVGGRVLRGRSSDSENALDFGTFTADRNGPHLLFLRATGKPGSGGFPVVRGAELTPQR
jgi:hexosaminidase